MNSDRLQAIGFDPMSAACWANILDDEEIRDLVQEVDTTATVNANTLARILSTKDHGQYDRSDYSQEGLSRFIREQLLCGGLGVPPDQASTFVDEQTTRLPVKCLQHILRMLPKLGTDYRQQKMEKFKASIAIVRANMANSYVNQTGPTGI